MSFLEAFKNLTTIVVFTIDLPLLNILRLLVVGIQICRLSLRWFIAVISSADLKLQSLFRFIATRNHCAVNCARCLYRRLRKPTPVVRDADWSAFDSYKRLRSQNIGPVHPIVANKPIQRWRKVLAAPLENTTLPKASYS